MQLFIKLALLNSLSTLYEMLWTDRTIRQDHDFTVMVITLLVRGGTFLKGRTNVAQLASSIRWKQVQPGLLGIGIAYPSDSRRRLFRNLYQGKIGAKSIDSLQSQIDQEGIALAPGLYLVATPIGNLEDITIRGLKILKNASAILAEDTRHSQKLLKHYNIDTRTYSFHEHNERDKEVKVAFSKGFKARMAPCILIGLFRGRGTQHLLQHRDWAQCSQWWVGNAVQILELLSSGQAIALISDAGKTTIPIKTVAVRDVLVSMTWNFWWFALTQLILGTNEESAWRSKARLEAGMPLISDPGSSLVRKAAEKGMKIFPVPGPSAILAALTASGLPANQFHYCGFLPPKQMARQKAIGALKGESAKFWFLASSTQLSPLPNCCCNLKF